VEDAVRNGHANLVVISSPSGERRSLVYLKLVSYINRINETPVMEEDVGRLG
jgi:hypothetical protein